MSRARYRYTFTESLEFNEARQSLQLAMLAVEATFGEARVRMDARFTIDPYEQAIIVDASTATGESLNQTFTYFLVREMSLGAFLIQRIDAAGLNGAQECQCVEGLNSTSQSSSGATS